MQARLDLEHHLREQLDGLRRRKLYRDPSAPELQRARSAAGRLGVPLLNACSNDYLGLARHVSRETCAGLPNAAKGQPHPAGAGASRLIHGTHDEHSNAEGALADWLAVDSSLLFSSGYAANVGLIAALATEEDLIVSDRLNHASLIDGCRMSRAKVRIYEHLDAEDAAKQLSAGTFRRRWLVSETYFGMDGDGPDLPALRHAADRFGAALLLDEAHALGVFGPGGRGLAHQAVASGATARADALVGTLGKAFGLQGAFVAGSSALRAWLWNRARSFVFSTASSPAIAEHCRQRVQVVEAAEPQRQTLLEYGQSVQAACEPKLLPPGRFGPIFPVLCGSIEQATRVQELFLDAGILVQAIRPPTVPQGTSRVRITLNAGFTSNDLERITSTLQRATETVL